MSWYTDVIVITLSAHFDGKVLVPDEPLELQPNQRVRISVEPIDERASPSNGFDWHSMLGAANHLPDNPQSRFPNDDALWEGTTGNHLETGPNKILIRQPSGKKSVE